MRRLLVLSERTGGRCPNELAGRGHGRDGGLAEYVVADAARALIDLRTLDPVAAAPLTEAGSTSYHAVRRVLPKLIQGSSAVVIGAGGLAVQILRATSPARVIAADTNPARVALARELGAHELLDGVDAATSEALRELTGQQWTPTPERNPTNALTSPATTNGT